MGQEDGRDKHSWMEVCRVGHFEKLPAWVVDSVEVNQDMADGIADRRLKKWFKPDFLIDHAAVFALGRQEGGLKRLQPPTMHRGVVLRMDLHFLMSMARPRVKLALQALA